MTGVLHSVRSTVVAAAVGILVMTLALAGCGRDVPAALQVGTTTIPAGEREAVPPVAGTTLDGQQLSVSGLAGRVVVLNSWASWCEPCKQEVPAFVALAGSADPADVAVVGLDVSDDPAAATAFATAFGMPYPSIVDASGDLLASLPGVPPTAIPSTLVIDRTGHIAARIIGAADRAELARIVADVAAEQPAS
jgi:thiol-disulfide isomerase/thioredoxin